MSDLNGNRPPSQPRQGATFPRGHPLSFNVPPRMEVPRSPTHPRPNQVGRPTLRPNMIGDWNPGNGLIVPRQQYWRTYRPPLNIPIESPESEEQAANSMSARAPPASPSSESSEDSPPELDGNSDEEKKDDKDKNKKRDDDDDDIPPGFRWVYIEIV